MILNKSDLISVGSGSPINVNWELVSHCQYNCSYCYYKPFKSKTDYPTLSKLVLTKLNMIKDPTKITLLGGEPTLHPSFLNIIETLFKMEHIRQICIVTNFIKPLAFWLDLIPFSSKIKIVISYHPEYQQKDMFDKILSLQDLFLLDFVFIIHNDQKYLTRMKDTAIQLERLALEKISINFVKIHENGKYREYPTEILEFMHNEQEKCRERNVTETISVTTQKGEMKIPKFEMINGNLNDFQGWSCKLRAFIIKEDGLVASACINKSQHIVLANFAESEVICPHKICECDDYWNFIKSPP